MKTLDDAWTWYERNKKLLVMMGRLGGRYWAELPADGRLGNDDDFRQFDGDQIRDMAREVLDELDDLAVFVIFSVFEASVRGVVGEDLQPEVEQLRHPALRRAAENLLQNVAEGSFRTNVLKLFKLNGSLPGSLAVNSLIEEVSRVRQYRNWVAHGRRGENRPRPVIPRDAYDILQAFLAYIRPPD